MTNQEIVAKLWNLCNVLSIAFHTICENLFVVCYKLSPSLGQLFNILWGYHKYIIDKCSDNLEMMDRFDPSNIGQLGTYVATANHILNSDNWFY